MARFRADEANNYGGQGGGGFFSIAKNKGIKQVRFMYNSIDDVEGFSVHKVKVNGKDRYVNCLRDYNSPKDDCPFCRESYPVQAKLFIPVYNIEEDQVQIWDRGKTMFEKIAGLCARYANNKNMVQNVFEVERHGEPNDMKTTYEIFQVGDDDTTLEDLPEYNPILGPKGLVLEKSFEDMEYYLEAGEFPPTEDDTDDVEEEAPRRREGRREAAPTGRRTPASSDNNQRRRREGF